MWVFVFGFIAIPPFRSTAAPQLLWGNFPFGSPRNALVPSEWHNCKHPKPLRSIRGGKSEKESE
jgi:hypothetical protein